MDKWLRRAWALLCLASWIMHGTAEGWLSNQALTDITFAVILLNVRFVGEKG